MDALKHIRLMAQYNQWMNARLYDAAAKLSHEQVTLNRGAFFGSLLGTLNHLVVTDIIWLKRLATHPTGHSSLEPVRRTERPASLDHTLHHDLPALSAQRGSLDAIISAWTAELSAADLDHVLEYRNMSGTPRHKLFGSLEPISKSPTHASTSRRAANVASVEERERQQACKIHSSRAPS